MDETLVRQQAQRDARAAAELLTMAEIQKSLRRPRTLFSFLMNALTTGLTLLAMAPLFSVVYMLLARGISRLNWAALTTLPPQMGEEGGGFGNAILGTLILVAVATAVSVPFGIMGAVYLAEVGPRTRLAQWVRVGAKILTGFPSVLAGVLLYGLLVVRYGYSHWAGGAALAILMIPTIMLTAEEAIRMVPARIREAAIGMGATSAQSILRVMLPTALPGILTGVMLAIARAAGETAPLLVTTFFAADHWPSMSRTPSLAVLIYRFSGSADDNQQSLAWAAAMTLVVIVLAINLIGQAFSRRAID